MDELSGMSVGDAGRLDLRGQCLLEKFKMLKQIQLKGVTGRSAIGWLEPRTSSSAKSKRPAA